MVSAVEIERELGVPRSTLWRLTQEKVVTAYPQKRQPWHRRVTNLYSADEVRAALGLPPAPPREP